MPRRFRIEIETTARGHSAWRVLELCERDHTPVLIAQGEAPSPNEAWSAAYRAAFLE